MRRELPLLYNSSFTHFVFILYTRFIHYNKWRLSQLGNKCDNYAKIVNNKMNIYVKIITRTLLKIMWYVRGVGNMYILFLYIGSNS